MSSGKNYKKSLFEVKKKRVHINLHRLNSVKNPGVKGKKNKNSSVNYKKLRQHGKDK